MTKPVKAVEPVTSRVKTDKHTIYCTPCRLWYAQEKKQCPTCGRGLLCG